MIFHVVGLPSNTTSDTSTCAFTCLTANFIKMMKSLGHTVYHYGVGCTVECDEDIVVIKPQEMDWTGRASYWDTFHTRITSQINARKTTGDFVCVINGWLNKPLATLTGVLVVEYAIGYNGTFAEYRVFASQSHLNKIRGAEGSWDPDGRWYDAVIPHYIDKNQYGLIKEPTKDYYLYIGRLTERKGIQIAIDTCKRLGVKLKVAGAGAMALRDCEPVGLVDYEEKIRLYQNAIATFCPTTYLEPFNMSVIESQMCGTPVISSPFGAFPENVLDGYGFKCATFKEFVSAAQKSLDSDRASIRSNTIGNWDLDVIRHKYNQYFQNLLQLWDKGWYTV